MKPLLFLVAALLGLVVCSCAPPSLVRDPSGHAVFLQPDFRHGSGLPYFCYNADAYNRPMTYCFLQADVCHGSMDRMRNVPVVVVKSTDCAASDDAYCYERFWDVGGQWESGVNCTLTADQCETSRQVSLREFPNLRPENVSACQRFDRSYQPRL